MQELLHKRDNNFDVLRLAAAAIVLVFHGFSLAGHAQPEVPFTDEPASMAGLLIFFAISGFLVSRSWLYEPRLVPFAIKRALRILPGLAVALVVTTYVIGGLSTSTGRLAYVGSAAPVEYVGKHSLLLSERGLHGRVAAHVADSAEDSLPGVFAGNPLQTVNGSIWTLPIEVAAYTLLVLAGLIALFWGNRTTRLAATAVFVGASAFTLRIGGPMTYSLYAVFAGGVLLYLLRNHLRLSWPLFAVAVAGWIASYQFPDAVQALLTGLTLPYAVVFLGFRGLDGLRWLTRPGDLSYGIYIYAWPIQQLVIQSTGTRSPAVVIALSAVATYAAAFVSWRLVERPALRLKRRLVRPSVDRTAERGARDLGRTESQAPAEVAAV